MDIASLLIPLLLAGTALWALRKRIDVYDALTAGASEGLLVLARIVPSLIALLTAVYMLRASGALTLLTRLLTPVLERLGIPPETAALLLVRPVSGSGALAVGVPSSRIRSGFSSRKRSSVMPKLAVTDSRVSPAWVV